MLLVSQLVLLITLTNTFPKTEHEQFNTAMIAWINQIIENLKLDLNKRFETTLQSHNR